MNRCLKPAWALLFTLTSAAAAAQAVPAPPPPGPSKSSAQIEAGEPRATTSPASADAAPAASGSARPVHAAASSSHVAAPARSAAATGQKGPAAVDRLDLGTATVTGDQEQPKVMYVVPWKKSDIGDLSGKPMNSLLDEALAPVDRDEFRREVAYYDAVRADTSQSGASPAAKQGEK
jgi:hypothetical protein